MRQFSLCGRALVHFGLKSTKVALPIPREMLSRPITPEPAKRSSICACSARMPAGYSSEKRASRTRDIIGRMYTSGVMSFRVRSDPPVIESFCRLRTAATLPCRPVCDSAPALRRTPRIERCALTLPWGKVDLDRGSNAESCFHASELDSSPSVKGHVCGLSHLTGISVHAETTASWRCRFCH